MPFNNGTYSLPSGNPVVTGQTISSTWANNTLNDLGTALSTCLLKDGSQTPTANIPLGNFRITGLGAATALTDAAQVAQVQNSAYIVLTAVSGTDTIAASATPTPAAYAAGQVFRFVPANDNTGATTLNISSLGAKNVYWRNSACSGGELKQNVPAVVYYDGTQFQLLNHGQALGGTVPVGNGGTGATTLTANNVLLGNGTSAVQFVAPGTSGNVLQSNGTTWASAALAVGSAANQAQMEAASSNAVAATPGNVNWHPGVAKCWIMCDSAGNINASHNVTSITDDGTGRVTVTIATDFSSANYAIAAGISGSPTNPDILSVSAQAAGSFQLRCYNAGVGLTDPSGWYAIAMGDQ